MTKQEFAQTIKEQYPYYADVDDDILANRIIEQYPYYADKITDNIEQKKDGWFRDGGKLNLEKAGNFVGTMISPSAMKFGEGLSTFMEAGMLGGDKLRQETQQNTFDTVDKLTAKLAEAKKSGDQSTIVEI